MEITYKYKIGQKVKLINPNMNMEYAVWGNAYNDLIGKEVTIKDRGWSFRDDTYTARLSKELQPFVFYYIEEDISANIGVWLMFKESAFDGENMHDVVNETPRTADGKEVELNMIALEHVMEWDGCNYSPNINFSFAIEGNIVAMRKNFKKQFNLFTGDKDTYTVKLSRTFLCYYKSDDDKEPHPCGDANRYGYEEWVNLEHTYAELPKDFAKNYLHKALHNDWESKWNIFDENDGGYWWREQWLKHFGIFDEIREPYLKQMPDKFKEEQKAKEELAEATKWAEEFVTGLSLAQKEALYNILKTK